MEVFGSAGTGVLPKQQVIDRYLAISVALTLRQQLLQSKHQGQRAFTSEQDVMLQSTVSIVYLKTHTQKNQQTANLRVVRSLQM